MKKAYDAASAFTTIISKTLDKSVSYKDFEKKESRHATSN